MNAGLGTALSGLAEVGIELTVRGWQGSHLIMMQPMVWAVVAMISREY